MAVDLSMARFIHYEDVAAGIEAIVVDRVASLLLRYCVGHSQTTSCINLRLRQFGLRQVLLRSCCIIYTCLRILRILKSSRRTLVSPSVNARHVGQLDRQAGRSRNDRTDHQYLTRVLIHF